MSHSYVNSIYHVVFGTKKRFPYISHLIAPDLYSYIGGIIRSKGSQLIAAGGMPEHIHLLTHLPRTESLSDFIRTIKANSSGFIHEVFPGLRDFAWQVGYGAFSVGRRELDKVEWYIQHQAEHHRGESYQDEFVRLLREEQVPFDTRYIWC